MKRRRFLPSVASLRQRVRALVVVVATLLLMFPVFVWAMAAMAVESGSVIPVGTLGEPMVTNAAELTTALRTGGVIRLAPGRYTGNFVIGVNGTTLVARGDLPDRRVAPADVSGVVLAPADPRMPPLRVSASHVSVTGLTVLNGAPDRETVVVGSHTASDVLQQPDDVTFDRVAVLAGESGGVRGFSLHTRRVRLTRSYVAGFWYRGRDAQAVWGLNGPGPYVIRDNYLEGSGENILFGGAAIHITNCIPSDVEIVDNTIAKPEAWRLLTGSVKNSVEFKAVRRALVEHNLIDGNWKDGQDGSAILLTPRNQDGNSPWVAVEDVTIRGNTLRRTIQGYAVSILGRDNEHVSGQTARIIIERNLFVDARNGIRVVGGVEGALTVRRNTFPAIKSNWLAFSGTGPLTPLTVTGNVARSGAYGISGDGSTAVGAPSLKLAKVVAFGGNVIERTAERSVPWPAGNTLLAPGELGKLLDGQFRHPDASVGY